ncbi:hypothetical protein JXA40_01515 [bacterium]|nr:hypothetical protein [candidate division CSSED10-310 bacterium]
MAEKIKSAYEIAMENLSRRNSGMIDRKLSDEQKQAIHEIRKTYQAKMAEREIMMKSKLAELQGSVSYEDYIRMKTEIEEKYRSELGILENELQRKVDKIRENSA